MSRHSSDSGRTGAHEPSARRNALPHSETDQDLNCGSGVDSPTEALSPEALESLRSFHLVVSAGKKLVVQRVDDAATGDLSPWFVRRAQPRTVSANTVHERMATEPAPHAKPRSAEPVTESKLVFEQSPNAGSIARRSGKRLRPARRTTQFPSWVWSLAAHAGLLLALSLLSIASFEPVVDFELSMTEAPFDELETLRQLEVDSELSDAMFESALESSLLEDLAHEVTDPTALEELAELAENSEGLEGLEWSEPLGLVGAAGNELTELTRIEEPLAVSFFGTQAEGRRIVFVLDNSGGMRYGQLEALVAELLRTVDLLSLDQRFYVIFYSDTVYPLFYPQSAMDFIRPTDRNKQRLRNWLETVEFCTGTTVDQAMAAAETFRPDVVYLLTDGHLKTTQDGRKLGYLLNASRRNFPIHTIGLGVGDGTRAAEELLQVAEANRGTFRAVPVTEEAEQLAQEKDRPYHNKEPGMVWGRGQGRGWNR